MGAAVEPTWMYLRRVLIEGYSFNVTEKYVSANGRTRLLVEHAAAYRLWRRLLVM
jgi:hypothetical protein